MHLIDIFICGVLLCFVVNGAIKGLVGKAFNFAGVVVGGWLALLYGAQVGAFLGLEGRVAVVVGSLLLLFAVAAVAALCGRVMARVLHKLGLCHLNTLLGVVLALCEGTLLLGILFKSIDGLWPTLISSQTRTESRCYGPVMRATEALFPSLLEYVDRKEKEPTSDASN
jgi:uncharacterized membrane protein required for colicin V production